MKGTNILLLAVGGYLALQWWKRRKETEFEVVTDTVAPEITAAAEATAATGAVAVGGTPTTLPGWAPEVTLTPTQIAAQKAWDAQAVAAIIAKPLLELEPALKLLGGGQPTWELGTSYWQGWLASRITTWRGAAAKPGVDPSLAAKYRAVADELERIRKESLALIGTKVHVEGLVALYAQRVEKMVMPAEVKARLIASYRASLYSQYKLIA